MASESRELECVRDDSTECDCPQCLADEDAFWRAQHGDEDEFVNEKDGVCPGCGATHERYCTCWQDDVPGPAVQR